MKKNDLVKLTMRLRQRGMKETTKSYDDVYLARIKWVEETEEGTRFGYEPVKEDGTWDHTREAWGVKVLRDEPKKFGLQAVEVIRNLGEPQQVGPLPNLTGNPSFDPR